MSYEPTNWKSGDVVTSAKLNKLESGVAGAGGLVVHATEESDAVTLDKTYAEIKAAVLAEQPVFILQDLSNEGGDDIGVKATFRLFTDNGAYCVECGFTYSADSADGVLSYTDDGGME